ncbi:hypothetical protein EUX98_g2273 [Antrodiella citrinella]|uniref:Uncharacterized protein n=1 Tax=Antrodiella citrinella TaxID=2447956 RepID=A0A4V3XJ73_9APHY|nr:hypothetical protein EUX98_g2273 [Antrodiella citrinella]
MFSIANNGGSSLPSLENLISVLQAAPVLRVLRLQGTWPHPTEDIEVLRGMLPTEMPYMKTAIFRTELAFTREFLSVVSFPDPSRVLLQMSIPAGETRIPTKAGRNIFSYALPDRVFFHNVGRQSEINGVFVTLDSVAGFSLVPGPLAFEVDTGSNPHDHTSLFWRDIVCAFADAMRHGRLGLNEHCAVLSLRGDENHALDLMPLLLALPNLEFIEVEGRYLFTLLDALGGVNLFSERDDVIVCPVLKRLRVRDLFVDDGVVAKLSECFHMRRECSGSEMRMIQLILIDPVTENQISLQTLRGNIAAISSQIICSKSGIDDIDLDVSAVVISE